jgi:hypothetical protein
MHPCPVLFRRPAPYSSSGGGRRPFNPWLAVEPWSRSIGWGPCLRCCQHAAGQQEAENQVQHSHPVVSLR